MSISINFYAIIPLLLINEKCILQLLAAIVVRPSHELHRLVNRKKFETLGSIKIPVGWLKISKFFFQDVGKCIFERIMEKL